MKKFSRILFFAFLLLFLVCVALVYFNGSIPFLSFKYWFSIFCLVVLFLFLIIFAVYTFWRSIHGGIVFLMFLALAVVSTGVGYIGGMEDNTSAIALSVPRQVTIQGFSNPFQVSADGSKIVYFAESTTAGNKGIWVADLSKDLKVSNNMMVDESTTGSNWNVRWISDKNEFSFLSDRNLFWDVMKYSLDTKELEKVYTVPGGLVISNLAYVPKDNSVYYVKDTFDNKIVSNFIKDSNTMDSPEILFQIESEMIEQGQMCRYLDVSTDAKKYAYTKKNFDNDSTELYIYEIKTKKEERISDDGLIVTDPKWSPDNQKLLYMAYVADGNYGLYLYNVNSGANEKITEDDISCTSPNWCNDGESIIYLATEDDKTNIYAMDIE